ncbi:vWA domain-containing protein [Streptomyces sp. NPDC003042]
MTLTDPRAAVEGLAASRAPYLLGIRHHSPALAAVVPALLEAAGAEVVCVELPTDFQPWLTHLGDPETLAPVALAGLGREGRMAFYPFADFSPELAAIRWARERGVEVVCCDLPLSDPGWSLPSPAGVVAETGPGADTAPDRGTDHGAVAAGGARGRGFADALAASGTGRDGDDLWDRAVEVLAPGCSSEAVRRAALGVGWALRTDAGAVPATDLAREAHMRRVIATASTGGRRVAALIGAFHAPALLPAVPVPRPADGPHGLNGPQADTGPDPESGTGPDHAVPAAGPAGATGPQTRRDTAARQDSVSGPQADTGPVAGSGPDPARPGGPAGQADTARPDGDTRRTLTGTDARRRRLDPARPDTPLVRTDQGGDGVVTSFVAYSFDLLDARSGYPAGIRDPLWQQAVFAAGGVPQRLREAASVAVTGVCRELRRAGHTAGTGEAAETLRLACDLAVLRGLPAPGRGELLEAVTTVLGQGELLGRGRALARALEAVLVGGGRGRTTPHAPRSGLGPSVEAELAALRLPSPEDPAPREVRLDPLRSELDGRREVLLQRLLVCGASYGEPVAVAATGDGTALGSKWRLSWTPSVPARLDLAGVRGVTAAQAAAGTLRDLARREAADGGPTAAQTLAGLAAAARCDLPELVDVRLDEVATVLPDTATLPELLDAVDLLEGLRRGHLPGGSPAARATAAALTGDLLATAVRCLPGLAGSDDPADAAALVALADRAAARRLGLRMDAALAELASTASPLMRGAALAVRVLLDLDPAVALGNRAAAWVDGAATADGRRTLARRLAGVLSAAGPLLDASPAALTPLLDRVDSLGDEGFLERLPALRGGFDVLSPAARDRLLSTVTERIGDRVDLSLDAPPALLALWAAADAAGLAALKELPLPAGSRSELPDPELPDPGPAGPAPPHADAPAGRRLAPADRWRLLLGRQRDRLPAGAHRYARALDELYGSGHGEGSGDVDRGGQGGGDELSFPTAREWSAELESLFGADVREEVLADAAGAGRTDVLAQLDPAAVRPSVELLSSVLSLAGGMPERQLARLRPLVRRLVDELAKELATRLRPTLSGLTTPRPTRRPGGRIDLARTLRANLAHTRRLDDGRVVVVPERPVFSTRASREADWRLILVVDVSGSMEASVIWSALTAAVLGGVPTLSTHFLAFSTQVVDLTDRVDDPLSLLLEVRVGGGTHIAAALAHARSLITVPSRTLVVVVSDFEEGAPVGGLLGEVRALAASGAHLLGCAALDDAGAPRYSVPVARQLVAAGMPVAALSPLALARWVGERLRGEPR